MIFFSFVTWRVILLEVSSQDGYIVMVTIRGIFPRRILARISILPKISSIWLCLRVQTDRCMTSFPYVFETLSRFESKQYRNPGQDTSRKNGTYRHPIHCGHKKRWTWSVVGCGTDAQLVLSGPKRKYPPPYYITTTSLNHWYMMDPCFNVVYTKFWP